MFAESIRSLFISYRSTGSCEGCPEIQSCFDGQTSLEIGGQRMALVFPNAGAKLRAMNRAMTEASMIQAQCDDGTIQETVLGLLPTGRVICGSLVDYNQLPD